MPVRSRPRSPAYRTVVPSPSCPALYAAGYRVPGQAPTQTRVMALM